MNNFRAKAKNLIILLILVTYLSACATTPVPRVTEEQRLKMGKVGLVSIANAPKNDVDIGPRGNAEGAASGAGDITLDILKEMGLGCLGAREAVVICVALLPPVLLGGATYGAISGAIKATSEEKAKEIETLLQATALAGDVQNQFKASVKNAVMQNGIKNVYDLEGNSEIVSGSGSANEKIKASPVNTILEIGVVSVNFINIDEEGGDDPTLSLQVTALARLIDAKTKSEVFKYSDYTHGTGSLKFSEWKASGAKLLKEELVMGCQINAKTIVEEIFLSTRTN
jgi:hypothetical protein